MYGTLRCNVESCKAGQEHGGGRGGEGRGKAKKKDMSKRHGKMKAKMQPILTNVVWEEDSDDDL